MTGKLVIGLVMLFSLTLVFSAKSQSSLRSILLEQLHTTHDAEDWFVPINIALKDLTAEQAQWSEGKGNHSAGQLANHLLFWNAQMLAKLTGSKPEAMPSSNDETFTAFTAEEWTATVNKLDKVMKDIEKFVETADEKTLAQNASMIAHIGTHNAYHVGQIIYVRKLQGSWNPDNGVK